MHRWDDMPFFRLLLPFASGILFSVYYPLPDIVTIATGFLAFVLVFVFFNAYKGLSFSWQYRHIPSILLLTATLLLGMTLTESQKPESNPYHFIHFKNDKQIIAKVVNDPEISTNSVKTILECKAALGEKTHPLSGKVMTFFAIDSNSINLRYGDYLIINFNPSEVKEVSNDFEFDYHRFLMSKNISHTQYLNARDWKYTGVNHGNTILKLGLFARNYFVSIFKGMLGKGEESAIVTGMFCGYRAEMSAETMASFSNTGVIHIMSVSGLHVGVIYLMLGFLLSYVPWIRKRKVIRLVIMLMVIWFYTILTGLSASIIRSAVMISFIAIGEIARQKINPINSVAAAAFILLIINPFSIFDIGFQLSFTAVLGIFLFYAPIRKLFNPKNKVLKYVWELSALSIAAQLATFPITSYYFHQFPVYFLPANLFAVPLSGLIIYISFALILLGNIPFVGEVIAWVLHWMVKLLVNGVGFIENLPHSSIKGIYPSLWATFLTTTALFLLWYTYSLKSKRILWLSILSIFSAVILSIYNKYERSTHDFMSFYNKSGNLIISLKQGGELTIAYAILQPHKLSRQHQTLIKAIEYYQIQNIRVINLMNDTPTQTHSMIFINPILRLNKLNIVIDPNNQWRANSKYILLRQHALRWDPINNIAFDGRK